MPEEEWFHLAIWYKTWKPYEVRSAILKLLDDMGVEYDFTDPEPEMSPAMRPAVKAQ